MLLSIYYKQVSRSGVASQPAELLKLWKGCRKLSSEIILYELFMQLGFLPADTGEADLRFCQPNP